jgi:hypothetical protein
MGLTARITKRLDVPHEPGQWIQIRKLPGRKLREATDVQQRAAFGYVSVLGKDGMEAVKSVTPEQIAAFQRSPSSAFDRGVLLRAAVVAWSYSDKPTPDEIEDLDLETEAWLADEVVLLSKPPKDEAAEKNA